jgi:hypothetical protein
LKKKSIESDCEYREEEQDEKFSDPQNLYSGFPGLSQEN